MKRDDYEEIFFPQIVIILNCEIYRPFRLYEWHFVYLMFMDPCIII